MSQDRNAPLSITACGYYVILRDWLASDVEPFIRWLSQGEWRLLDAPWEGYRSETTPEQAERDREWFAKQLEDEDRTWLKRRAVIATASNVPLGWVSRYGEKENPHVCKVGIAICEDAYLNRGLGTEALRLWVNHIFDTTDVHKVALDTWSFNPRMIRVAEKAGFVREGCQREIREWQGEWLDLVHFGILREEWEERRGGGEVEQPERMGPFFDDKAAGYDEYIRGNIFPDEMFAQYYQDVSSPIEPTSEPIRVLDLGCGTGLEINALLQRAPNARITGIDLAEGMLDLLRARYADHMDQITLVVDSFLTVPLGTQEYDYALSTMSMHHVLHETKLALYKKIHAALKPGAKYVEGDSVVPAVLEPLFLDEYYKDAADLSPEVEGQYHIDIPFSLETQRALLLEAGFKDFEVLWQKDPEVSWNAAVYVVTA